MNKTMKKLSSILALVGAVAFAQSVQAATQTLSANVGVNEKISVTFDQLTTAPNRSNWVLSGGDASIATVKLTSSASEAQPTLSVEGLKVGTATWTLTGQSGSWSTTTHTGTLVVQVVPVLKFSYHGVNFTVKGAETNYVGGELVMKFTESGSMQIDKPVEEARVLVIGGGGSGRATRNNGSTGYGGQGGRGSDNSGLILPAGTYTVTVGEGGESVDGSSTATDGKPGSPSSFGGVQGFTTLTGNGGAAGGSSAPSGNPTSSDIEGTTPKSYGANGRSGSSGSSSKVDGGANTGDGGSGVYRAVSGAGGSGVVIVRVPVQKPSDATKVELDLGSTQPKVFTIEGGTLKSGYDTSVVTAAYAENKLQLTPKGCGETEVEVETSEKKFVYQVMVLQPIYMNVDDAVAMRFYGSQNSARWTTDVNGEPLTGTGRKDASGFSFQRGDDARDFTITVTAKTLNQGDTLVVKSTAGTAYAYYYHFFVSGARRSVSVDKTVSFTCASQVAHNWSATKTDAAGVTLVNPTDSVKTVNGTITGLSEKDDASVTVTGSTANGNGERSLTYTLAVTVNKKPIEPKDPFSVNVGSSRQVSGSGEEILSVSVDTKAVEAFVGQVAGSPGVIVNGKQAGWATVLVEYEDRYVSYVVTAVDTKKTFAKHLDH